MQRALYKTAVILGSVGLLWSWQGCGGISPDDLANQNQSPPITREEPKREEPPAQTAPTKIYNRNSNNNNNSPECLKDPRGCNDPDPANPSKQEPRTQPPPSPGP
ncbi:MAG: hypothetical protein EP343_23855 [Deltaproteobacteria bacterium]|nr:MAG: hypothetical protein EP343_23855 [Deltaproteobacteria bacterium]